MKIALCHFRVGETDGVSLEMDKWKKALELSGHEVIYIAGSAGNCDAEIIPALHYNHPINNRIVDNVYRELKDYKSEQELKEEVFAFADLIEDDLIKIIEREKVELLVPNNILSLGWGLSAGIAFTNAIKETGVKVLCHHHDFHWERELYSKPKVAFAAALLTDYFPPVADNISHVCINHIAKKELKSRYHIDADVVPNVFDFKQELIVIDEYNKDLRKELGIKSADLVFVQATRVVERKAIELAIDFVSELEKLRDELLGKKMYSEKVFSSENKMVLVLAGKNESPDYYQKLQEYAKIKGVTILDISDRISHNRSYKSGNKIYSLWDAYSIADMVTYPSILEGWGNQFLEAIVAKLPVATYKYPVYLTDIEKFNFNVVSLGCEHSAEEDLVKVDSKIMENAAKKSLEYLLDDLYRTNMVEFNYELAAKELSIESLRVMLNNVLGNERN